MDHPHDNSTPLALKTVEEHVVDALRERIVRGIFRPEETLRLADLSGLLGVSTMPVRHALRRLEAERLVRQAPRRGAFVAPLEIDDLEEVQAIRAGIEGLAARKGAEKLTDVELELMRALLGEIEVAAREPDVDRLLAAQWELHEICYRAAGRPRLLELIVEHRRRAERYIRVALVSDGGGKVNESLSWQERFVSACEARDSRAAEVVISQAMAWTVKTVAADLDGATPASP